MRIARWCRIPLLAGSLSVASIGAASAQDEVSTDNRVRQLYASAEYEQALVLLGTAETADARLYRALCLLALGRQDETSVVLTSLVRSSPDFTVSAEEVPPRFVTMLTETRRELLPGILRRLFSDARAQYQAKDYREAVVQFEKVLELSSAPDMLHLEDVADLRVLAEGFRDLAKAPVSPAAAAAAPAPAPPPVLSTVRTAATQPTPIRQEMPPWPRNISSVTTTNGLVRVRIDKAGRVTSATIIKGISPQYDRLLLAATRFWEYNPATINGTPTASESVIEVRVTR